MTARLWTTARLLALAVAFAPAAQAQTCAATAIKMSLCPSMTIACLCSSAARAEITSVKMYVLSS